MFSLYLDDFENSLEKMTKEYRNRFLDGEDRLKEPE